MNLTPDQESIMFFVYGNLEVSAKEIQDHVGMRTLLDFFKLVWNLSVLQRDNVLVRVKLFSGDGYRIHPEAVAAIKYHYNY